MTMSIHDWLSSADRLNTSAIASWYERVEFDMRLSIPQRPAWNSLSGPEMCTESGGQSSLLLLSMM